MTSPANIDLLKDVRVRVSAEIGTCSVSIAQVLQLGTGSLVQLNRAAGEAVDLLVNGKLLARGEIIAIDDRYGVRVTEVVRKESSAS